MFDIFLSFFGFHLFVISFFDLFLCNLWCSLQEIPILFVKCLILKYLWPPQVIPPQGPLLIKFHRFVCQFYKLLVFFAFVEFVTHFTQVCPYIAQAKHFENFPKILYMTCPFFPSQNILPMWNVGFKKRTKNVA